MNGIICHECLCHHVGICPVNTGEIRTQTLPCGQQFTFLLDNGDSLNITATDMETALTTAIEVLRGTGIEIIEIHG